MAASIKTFLKRLTPQDWLEHRARRKWYEAKRQAVPSVSQALVTLERRWPHLLEPGEGVTSESECQLAEAPVFVLGAAWRCGSTLVQRLVNSDPQILMWGEPYADANPVQTMADSLRVFTEKQPIESNFIDSDNFQANSSELAYRWTANLYPEIAALKAAHLAFFETLFAQPAKHRGYSRWGIKEVRLDIHHARYLHWLFPQAKFLFLYRDPYKAYHSCRIWRNLYVRWPDEGIDSPARFGHSWKTLVEGYLAGATEVGGMVLKYEDFCAGRIPVSDLAHYLKLDLKVEVLQKRIGSHQSADPTPRFEIKQLQQAVEPLASQLGYLPPA